MSATLKFTMSLLAREYYANEGEGNTVKPHTRSTNQFLPDGTTSAKVRFAFSDTRSLVATSEELDLAGSGLTTAQGTTITFTKVNLLYIYNTHASTALTYGNPAANPFLGPLGAIGHTYAIPAGEFLLFFHGGAGWTVTAGTGDKIKIDSGAATISYDITIVG